MMLTSENKAYEAGYGFGLVDVWMYREVVMRLSYLGDFNWSIRRGCCWRACDAAIWNMCVCVLMVHLQRSVSEWMFKALQVELQDWQRDQEPDTDHEGFYQTSLPTIITQVHTQGYPPSYEAAMKTSLYGTEIDAGGKCPCCSDDWREPTRPNHPDGAVRDGEASQQVCVPISWRHQGSWLWSKVLTSSCRRFREALVELGKEHRRVPDNHNNRFYLHYLLASISNCIVLK